MKSDKNKAIMSKKSNGAGRPRIIIDPKIIANLAQIGCTQEEIGSVIGISARTLQRNYADIIWANREKGKASLRKKMWDKALTKDNTNMQVWLSKNYLGMKDRTVTENITEPLPLIIDGKAEDVEEQT
jgi:alkylhydroperoxidase/carboxymuconolactone decarboxylase family protein YurZ